MASQGAHYLPNKRFALIFAGNILPLLARLRQSLEELFNDRFAPVLILGNFVVSLVVIMD